MSWNPIDWVTSTIDSVNPINIATGLWQSNRAEHYQQDMLGLQQQFSREMYQRQREDALADRLHLEEYNSPKHMMSMLGEGGVNPYTIGGQIGSSQTVLPHQASGQSVGSPGKYEAFRLDLSTILGVEQQKANIDLINAEKDLKEAQAKNLDYKNQMESYRSQFYELWANFDDAAYRAEKETIVSKKTYWSARADTAAEQMKNNLLIQSKILKEKQSHIDYLDAKTAVERAMKESNVELNEKKVEYYTSLVEGLNFTNEFNNDTKELGFWANLIFQLLKIK